MAKGIKKKKKKKPRTVRFKDNAAAGVALRLSLLPPHRGVHLRRAAEGLGGLEDALEDLLVVVVGEGRAAHEQLEDEASKGPVVRGLVVPWRPRAARAARAERGQEVRRRRCEGRRLGAGAARAGG